MNTINRRKAQFSVIAVAVLAIATIATVLAVTYTTGPAQAQSNFGLNTGKYEDPKPCGIGMLSPPADPDDEFSEGHIALFDAYWDYNSQTLNNNLCPPLAVHTVVRDDFTQEVTGIITARKKSNIDIDETVFHAGDEFKAIVVDSGAPGYNASDYDDQETIDRAKYDFLPPAGTEVWWLKQDDPIAEAEESGPEEPELVLGLSAGLFDDDDWYLAGPLGDDADPVPPLQYEFEAERDPEGNPIPFLVFDNDAKRPIWDSRNADTNSIQLDPGQYKHYNWVFFPGAGQNHTYVLEVHMKGHVRVKVPEGKTKDNWKPLTWPIGAAHDPDNPIVYDEIVKKIDKVVTSEVKRYTIQVGDDFEIVEPPLFGASLRVKEHAPAGTKLGDPIGVIRAASDAQLTYSLAGEGHEAFKVVKVAEPRGAQIVVKDSASVDHETRSQYELVLEVSDGLDREGNSNDAVDHTFGVDIAVDNLPTVSIAADNANLRVGETATVTATIDLPSGARLAAWAYQWNYWKTGGTRLPHADTTGSFSLTQTEAGTWHFVVQLQYLIGQGANLRTVVMDSNQVTVTWSK